MVTPEYVDRLAKLCAAGRVVVVSGAGLSTDSGIPDYRGPSGVLRRHRPMTIQEFLGGEQARQRYWARSHLGWRHVVQARCNDGHRAVAHLERAGFLAGIVTQNVDGLHQVAGARDVVELHGNLARVVCLSCHRVTSRVELDGRLRAANPQVAADAATVNPDGDAEVPVEVIASFRVVGCAACDGLLKPDVVFFGETVPRERVDRCFALVESARLLLVLGSSLTVMSGYRFVLRAAKIGIPVAIVNAGETRGDPKADLKIDAPLGAVLPAVAARLAPVAHAAPA